MHGYAWLVKPYLWASPQGLFTLRQVMTRGWSSVLCCSASTPELSRSGSCRLHRCIDLSGGAGSWQTSGGQDRALIESLLCDVDEADAFMLVEPVQ